LPSNATIFIVHQYYVNSKLPVSTEIHPQPLYKYEGWNFNLATIYL